MQDRKVFFESLYTKTNLEAAKFPFQQEASAFLESEEFQRLLPCHVATDPTSRELR
jgi:hypothetical protein